MAQPQDYLSEPGWEELQGSNSNLVLSHHTSVQRETVEAPGAHATPPSINSASLAQDQGRDAEASAAQDDALSCKSSLSNKEVSWAVTALTLSQSAKQVAFDKAKRSSRVGVNQALVAGGFTARQARRAGGFTANKAKAFSRVIADLAQVADTFIVNQFLNLSLGLAVMWSFGMAQGRSIKRLIFTHCIKLVLMMTFMGMFGVWYTEIPVMKDISRLSPDIFRVEPRQNRLVEVNRGSQGPDEWETLWKIQGASFEALLDESVGGSALALEVKQAEMATRDLASRIRVSDLRTKVTLARILDDFVSDAKKTGRGLQSLSSRVYGAVDR